MAEPLRQMNERGLAAPLSERSNYGRLYALTDKGRATVGQAFHVSIPEPAATLASPLYAWVARSRLRRRVLLGLVRLEEQRQKPQTASSIRKFISPNDTVEERTGIGTLDSPDLASPLE